MSYIRTAEHRERARLLGLSNKGRKATEQQKLNQSKALKDKPRFNARGENHARWNPDRESYYVLHNWVREQLGKPNQCTHCHRTDAKAYDWANISGEYKKDLTDWIRLCRSCHLKMDYTPERKAKQQATRAVHYGNDWQKQTGVKGLNSRYKEDKV